MSVCVCVCVCVRMCVCVRVYRKCVCCVWNESMWVRTTIVHSLNVGKKNVTVIPQYLMFRFQEIIETCMQQTRYENDQCSSTFLVFWIFPALKSNLVASLAEIYLHHTCIKEFADFKGHQYNIGFKLLWYRSHLGLIQRKARIHCP